MYLNPRFACSNQNELWNHYEGIDNKTQLFFKIISMLSRLFGGSLKKESPSMPSIVVHLLSLLHYQPISPSPKTQRFPFAPLSALPPSHSRHTKLPFWTNPTTTVLLPLCPKSTRPAASAAPAPPENSLCKFFFFYLSMLVY